MLLVKAITIYALISTIDILALIFFEEDTEAGQIARSIGILLFGIELGFIVSRGVISIICDLI